VLMRARSGTVRFIESHHDLERKTIHLRSTQAENRV
jgi:fructose-1,6-bisphosphatase II